MIKSRISIILLFVFAFLFLSLMYSCTNDKISYSNSQNSSKFIPSFDLTNPKYDIQEDVVVFGDLNEGEYYEGKILVGYENKSKVLEIVRILDGKITNEIPELGVVSIEFNDRVENAYAKLQKTELRGIKYVEPSYKRHLIEPSRSKESSELLSLKSEFKPLSRNFGEELSNSLWGLEAIGITTSLWTQASGAGIVVAVVDTGVDGTHPDLIGQVVKGYRPLTNTEIPEGADSSYGGAHGTHVAGIIAAKKDGKGSVGVAPNAKIMPIVIFDVNGQYVGDDNVAKGIVWAVDKGAKIMNHSWGGWGYSHTLKLAFDYALKRNVLMIVSAGNGYTESHHMYPANYPGVIQVAAAEYNNGNYKTALFSSRSDGVTVAAPGVSILSTVPGEGKLGYEGYNPNIPVTNGGTYDYYDGTSMAAPHVAGVAALLLQKYPSAKAWQIRKILQNTAYDIDNIGWDKSSGYGLIKANNALSESLPATGGVEEYHFVVKDSKQTWGIPTVSVQLIRQNGASYFVKTDKDGDAALYQIDSDKYNVYISGPDHMERANRNFEKIALRLDEEKQYILSDFQINSSGSQIIKFKSSLRVKFNTPIENAFFVITDPTAKKLYKFDSYQTNTTFDLSELSGRVTIGILTLTPAVSEINVQGVVTLNGKDFSVSGKLSKGSRWVVLDDFGGPNLNTEEEPRYYWWTVFGNQD